MLALNGMACAPTTATPTAVAAAWPLPSPVLPEQVASTGTASIAGSPTQPPAPREFTESFDGKPPYWVFLQTNGRSEAAAPSIRDGFLVFDLAERNEWGYALYNAHAYPSVLIETELQMRTVGDGAAGLVCNYDESQGWYEFSIFEDQTYQLLFGQWLSKGVARYVPLYQGTSPDIRSDTNRISLECQGNVITPSINGVPLRKWPEEKFGLHVGKAGLAAASFQDVPFTSAFDWVRVTEP